MQEKETSYLVPSNTVSVDQVIKRSRFIAAVGRAVDKKKAIEFIDEIRSLYPDATHHCYAFIAGPPANTANIGMSDDGEPQGTAGRPILSILQYSRIGEIVSVVTRYFGGTKLGTGGLVRAYSSSVQQALQKIKLEEFSKFKSAQISFPYSSESSIRYICEKMNVVIITVEYLDCVKLVIEFQESISEELFKEIRNQTRGEAEIKR